MMLQGAPQLYLDEIQDWIAITHEALLSKTALHMLLADAGFSYKRLCKAATEHDDEAREAWQQYVQENLVASMMVTADETSKDDHTIFRRWGRSPRGHRAEITA